IGKVQADDCQQHTRDKNQWGDIFHGDLTEGDWLASRFTFMFSEHQARDGGTTARQLSRACDQGQTIQGKGVRLKLSVSLAISNEKRQRTARTPKPVGDLRHPFFAKRLGVRAVL